MRPWTLVLLPLAAALRAMAEQLDACARHWPHIEERGYGKAARRLATALEIEVGIGRLLSRAQKKRHLTLIPGGRHDRH